MATISMLMMAAGILISTIGVFLKHNGPSALYGSLDWCPASSWFYSNPGATLLIGLLLLAVGLVCQPRRIA